MTYLTSLQSIPVGKEKEQEEKKDGLFLGFSKGFTKGVGQTLSGASSLGEQIISFGQRKKEDTLGGRLIERGTFEAKTGAEKAGKIAETIAEFLLPSGLAAKGALRAEQALGLGTKIGEGLLTRGGKLVSRAAVRGGAEAISTGLVEEARTGGDTEMAAKSALGAGVFTGALSPALDVGASIYRQIKPGAVESFIRGLAPTGKKATEYNQTAKTALSDILGEAERKGVDLSKSEDVFGDTIELTKGAKNWIWKQYETLKGTSPGTIDGNQIAKAMKSVIDKRMRTQTPEIAEKIQSIADTYRRPLTIDEAEEFLRSVNSDLQSYYAKNKVGRSAAMADPEKAYVVKEAEAIRDALYSKIDELGGEGSKELKKRYGALTETEKYLYHRKAVTDRLKPMNLAEQVSLPMAGAKVIGGAATGRFGTAAEGFAQLAATKAIKEAQTNENLLRRAFKVAGKEGIVPVSEIKPRPFTPAGLLEAPPPKPIVPPYKDTSGIIRQTPNPTLAGFSDARIKAIERTIGRPLNAKPFGQ